MGDRERRRDLTLEEAEYILEEARSKDFWSVDGYFDNRRQLQDAIDIVYNCIPGNDYVVDYMENQNGTRLMVVCRPCSKELLSYDPFFSHEKGKPHNKVKQQELAPKDPNLQVTLKRRPLNFRKEIFPHKSLEDDIDYCQDPILGIQFVYKTVIEEKDRFTCTLCSPDDDDGSKTSIKRKQMLKHLKSRSHNLRYMKVKFGYRLQSEGQFMEDARCYEEIEGKIHALIIDFTKHRITQIFPKREIKKEKKTRYRHQSNSSSSGSECSKRARLSTPAARSRYSSSRSRDTTPAVRDSESLRSRLPSPVLIKQERISPENSREIVRQVTQVATNKSQLRILMERIKILEEPEALRQVQFDEDMQRMLHQCLCAYNKKLQNFFSTNNTICIDEKGNVVAEAAGCTESLVKHLNLLQIV